MVLIHVRWLIHCLGLIKRTAFKLLLETVMVMGHSVANSVTKSFPITPFQGNLMLSNCYIATYNLYPIILVCIM